MVNQRKLQHSDARLGNFESFVAKCYKFNFGIVSTGCVIVSSQISCYQVIVTLAVLRWTSEGFSGEMGQVRLGRADGQPNKHQTILHTYLDVSHGYWPIFSFLNGVKIAFLIARFSKFLGGETPEPPSKI